MLDFISFWSTQLLLFVGAIACSAYLMATAQILLDRKNAAPLFKIFTLLLLLISIIALVSSGVAALLGVLVSTGVVFQSVLAGWMRSRSSVLKG